MHVICGNLLRDCLTSGQCRTTGNVVAVKVIDKLRFPHKQDASLRQEAAILQNLNYPGIILLERMFENPEKVFITQRTLFSLNMCLSSSDTHSYGEDEWRHVGDDSE